MSDEDLLEDAKPSDLNEFAAVLKDHLEEWNPWNRRKSLPNGTMLLRPI